MNRSGRLEAFLDQTPVRTGRRHELVALAEMAGYGTQDAHDLGHRDLFDAVSARSLREVPNTDSSPPGDEATLRVALLRGLTYLAPALAILSLYPNAPHHAEIVFIVLALALGWAYGQQMTYVVSVRLPIAPRLAWRRAALGASAVVAAILLGAWGLVSLGVFGVTTATLGVLYVVIFAAAGPLMAQPVHRGLLGSGLAAGIAAALASLTGSVLATSAVILMLVMPLALLALEWARAPRAPEPGVRIPRSQRTAHATYGLASAALVAWLPIMLHGTSVVTFAAVNLAALAFAEAAVVQMRRLIERMLGHPFRSADFRLMANGVVLRGLLHFIVPIALVTAVLAAWLMQGGLSPRVAGWGVAAVVLLSVVQMLGLILTTLHGVRWAAGGVLVGSVLLWLRAGSSTGPVEALAWYAGILTVLSLALLVFALRRSARPLNYL